MQPGDTFDVAFNMRDYPRTNILVDTVSAVDGRHKYRMDTMYSLSSIVYRVKFLISYEINFIYDRFREITMQRY